MIGERECSLLFIMHIASFLEAGFKNIHSYQIYKLNNYLFKESSGIFYFHWKSLLILNISPFISDFDLLPPHKSFSLHSVCISLRIISYFAGNVREETC